jgi:hypothetical protein
MRTQLSFALLATALAYSLATVPANARTRTFVASYGNAAIRAHSDRRARRFSRPSML